MSFLLSTSRGQGRQHDVCDLAMLEGTGGVDCTIRLGPVTDKQYAASSRSLAAMAE
jgi:hypothetical protein